jgi:hypothetical protein
MSAAGGFNQYTGIGVPGGVEASNFRSTELKKPFWKAPSARTQYRPGAALLEETNTMPFPSGIHTGVAPPVSSPGRGSS